MLRIKIIYFCCFQILITAGQDFTYLYKKNMKYPYNL